MSEERIEFTPEQQAYVDALIAEKTKGLFTKEDLEREITREVDRRVESGIKKGIETHKAKWEEEFRKQSELTAEELAEKQIKDKLKELESRERELALRANTLDAKSMLANAGIPKEHYEKFVGMLVDGDEERTKENVQNFIDAFNETKVGIEKSLQEKYSNVPSPKGGSSDGGIKTKAEFNKLSYEEKLKFKEENPELFKQFVG